MVKDAVLDQKIPFACIIIGIIALFASFIADWAWPAVFIPILICGVPIIRAPSWGSLESMT